MSPSRNSIASREPVEAPEGTAARPITPDSSSTSASMVGLPRESRISRATTSTMELTDSPPCKGGCEPKANGGFAFQKTKPPARKIRSLPPLQGGGRRRALSFLHLVFGESVLLHPAVEVDQRLEQLLHQRERPGVRPVGERLRRVRVRLHEESRDSGRDRGAREHR